MCTRCKQKTTMRRIKRTFNERHFTHRTERKYQCTSCGQVVFVR